MSMRVMVPRTNVTLAPWRMLAIGRCPIGRFAASWCSRSRSTKISAALTSVMATRPCATSLFMRPASRAVASNPA
ncbi:MAG TPA: hypothetical protein VKE41_09060 [Roseiflexaceae bacterium]|nr:hypothetical protein [Roseiflexaceae bacterium]